MKILTWIVGAIVVIGSIWYLVTAPTDGRSTTANLATTTATTQRAVRVTPISHATAVLSWDNVIMYVDPIGGTSAFAGQPTADIILVTDIHSDHLSTSTLQAVVGSSTTLIVPQAVKDQLPQSLASRAKVLKNGDSLNEEGFNILAMPMYNLPETADSRHSKGRGNGYVIERGDTRVYIAGDTAGISEMRALKNIDIAFVPMNLPFTMSVEEAADAVLAFKPTQVYPYHYRGQNGLSDVAKFKQLVNAGDPNIEVVQLNWYP